LSQAGSIDRLAVLGLGLLGGSIVLAARARGVAREVAVATRSPSARARALEFGAARAVEDPADAVRGAQLVVLATPVSAMADVLRRCAPGLSVGAVVTDVGSVKQVPCEELPSGLPKGVVFIGAHPMAGGHESGPEFARADLFEGAACVVSASGSEPAAECVRGFWKALGCRIFDRDPKQHDLEVAWTSHVPHVLAFAFAAALRDAPAGAADLLGPGFRDFTRIARSQPELWGEILAANSKALAGPLDRVRAVLAEFTLAIESGEAAAIEQCIGHAQKALFRALPAERIQEPAQRASSEGARASR
jgi:prephenate dehydrogenase